MTPRPIPQPGSGPDLEVSRRMAREGHYDQAIAWLERALSESDARDVHMRCVTALGEVSAIAEHAGEPEVALRAARRAREAAPDWADLQLRCGRLFALLGRRAEAREALDHALQLNPRYRAARIERALLDAREGRIAEAVDVMQGLAEETPVAEPAALQQGLRALTEAEFETAAELLRRALVEQDPRLTEQLRLYQDLITRDEPVLALQALRSAVAAYPTYPDLMLLLGVQELQMGSVDDSLDSFTRALELNPDYHAARVQLARALDAAGDAEEAQAQVLLVLEREPAHAEAAELLALWSGRRRASRMISSPLRKVS